MDSSLYKKAEEYVTALFEKMPDPKLVYHNLRHTKDVVERVKEIAEHYYLNERDKIILYTAAWFHDTGHLFTSMDKHEERSVEEMRKFMEIYSNQEDLVAEIEDCILSTKFPTHPNNLLQQIICDADTYNFGTKEFREINKPMYEEYVLREGEITKQQWDEKRLKLLETHQYYTTYCKELLNEGKKQNRKKLKKKIFTNSETDDLVIKQTDNLATKGIQTMLRITSENHMKLSDMADRKANLLISVNAIIISVILSVLMRKLQDEPYLTIPTIIFLLVAVVTIVISILATRPKISGGTFSPKDIQDKKANLLFFGHFYKSSYEDYDIALRKMMNEPDYLYGSLIKNIYQLGVVLGRKYRLVRLAYNIFMIGIVISVIAFAIAAYFGADTSSAAASSPF
ncbi:MAG: Pycsar system effector family protein [Ilyomonas sp.]